MRECCICHKAVKTGRATFFKIPKDDLKRKKWSELCGIQLSIGDSICEDHFASSDIIKRHQKVLLAPNAMPCVLTGEIEKKCSPTNPLHNIAQSTDLDTSFLEYNTNYDDTKINCRCCTNFLSQNFNHLDSCIKPNEDEIEKTYRDILYEITNQRISLYHENVLPQHICEKCEIQLKNSYNFIQQVCRVSQEYLSAINEQNGQEDIKNIENLQESLIEIAGPSSLIEQDNDKDFKVEPVYSESSIEIKQEKFEADSFTPIILNNEESQEKKDFLQNFISENQSENEEDSDDEPESIKSIDMDLSNESIARRCDICHKVYKNEKFLKEHKRYTHIPEENKMPCPLCSYKASRKSALKVHMGLVHGQDKVNEYFKPVLNSNKTFPCNQCPRSYGRKDSLRRHIARKHLGKSSKEDIPKKSTIVKPKEKRFLCTYCGQSYSSNSCLESHALTHTGERPFSCEICNKTFKRLKDLQLHRVIHSDEKPHQCSECGKAFKRVDKLKIHMRVHSDLRPYKCSECHKTFKYPNVLRTHMHIHTGQTPFHCKTCGEAFSLRTSLNNHCLKNGHVK